MVHAATGRVDERIGLADVRETRFRCPAAIHEQLAEVPFLRAKTDPGKVGVPDAVFALGPYSGDRSATTQDHLHSRGRFPYDQKLPGAGILWTQFKRRVDLIDAFRKNDLNRIRESFGEISRTCFCAACSVATGLATVPGWASSPSGAGATWISTAADRETTIRRFDAIAHATARNFIPGFA